MTVFEVTDFQNVSKFRHCRHFATNIEENNAILITHCCNIGQFDILENRITGQSDIRIINCKNDIQ